MAFKFVFKILYSEYLFKAFCISKIVNNRWEVLRSSLRPRKVHLILGFLKISILKKKPIVQVK